MTKIYRKVNMSVGSVEGFWVVQAGKAPVFFWIAHEYVKASAWPRNALEDAWKEGFFCLLTHAAALDLLAHWPAGHAELAAILADDPETEYAITSERKER